MLTTPMAGGCDSLTKRKRSTCVVLYGCALSPDPKLVLVDFCFLSDFRIKQVLNLNLQFPLYVITDRCYSKCSGVGRVQQVANGGGGVWSHHFRSADWAYQSGMVANSSRGQLNRKNRLRTRNRESQHTLYIFDTDGPFAVNALSHRLP